MSFLSPENYGKGFKELSVLPGTYLSGSRILDHLLPVASGTFFDVTKEAPSLKARNLIWRSTHPGDGEGLIGIMPSGQSVQKVEASTAVLALLDTPSHFSHLRISSEVQDALRNVFYLGHNVTERNVGLKGMSDKLAWRFPEEVSAIQAFFASQIRWIVMPFLVGENLTITEHPNIEGYRIDQMGNMNYESMLHYDYSSFMGKSSLREPIMVMPDGAYIGQKCRGVVSNSDEDNIIRMASELMAAVRETGTYPSDVCLQIECGIPKSGAEKAYLFQVRIIGPKYNSGTGIDEKDALLKWQFGPKVPSLKNQELWDVWELNNWHGADGLGETSVTLHSNTLYPLGYPPAYAPVGGMKVSCDESQFSFGHNHTRLLNWAARGGKYGPGIYEQVDKHRKGLEEEKISLQIPFSEKRKASSTSATNTIDEELLDRVHRETYLSPSREKEPTPQEQAIIHEHIPIFEEKEVLSYEACMRLLGEILEICTEIPYPYFGDNYGGSRLEIHKYKPRKKLISDEQWRENHNYDRPYYAIDYDRPMFDDEESITIRFDNHNCRNEKISFRWRNLSLEIDRETGFINFSSDRWSIENEGGYMTGTIIYGYCPEDENGMRSIAHTQHVFGKECQKTPEYYRHQNPIIEPISRMSYLKECFFGKPEKPPFTGTKYQRHSTETLKSASDMLGPMLLRLKDAFNITLQTDPRTFLRHQLLWKVDVDKHLARISKN